MRALLAAALLLTCASSAALAQEMRPVCGDRLTMLKALNQRHDESPIGLGLSADGGVLELLTSPDGGWTLLVTYPKRPTCVLAVGQAWTTLRGGGDPV